MRVHEWQGGETPFCGLSHTDLAWGPHLAGHCGDAVTTLNSSGLKYYILATTLSVACGWGAPPALGLGPALGARCSSTSWNVVSEHIIQGALQGHKTALGVTLFIFNYCVCVSTYIEACSPREVRTAANSRILPALMQRADNSLHSNQIASREKISFQGMRSGRLDCIILYWHFERIISLQLGLFLWKKWRL